MSDLVIVPPSNLDLVGIPVYWDRLQGACPCWSHHDLGQEVSKITLRYIEGTHSRRTMGSDTLLVRSPTVRRLFVQR